jgi:hypothetical protein
MTEKLTNRAMGRIQRFMIGVTRQERSVFIVMAIRMMGLVSSAGATTHLIGMVAMQQLMQPG